LPAIPGPRLARSDAAPTSGLLSCGYSLLYVLSRCIPSSTGRNIRDHWRNPALEVSYPWGPARSVANGQPTSLALDQQLAAEHFKKNIFSCFIANNHLDSWQANNETNE